MEEVVTTTTKKCTKKCRYCGKYKLMMFVLFPMGVLLLLAGMFIQPLFNSILKTQIGSKLVLQKGSETFQHWTIPPIPVYVKFNIFNYTNVINITTKGHIPHVDEIGPFTYREIRFNQVVDYNEYNITYIQNFTYEFEPSLSCTKCHENVTVYVPNMSLMTVMRDLHDKVKNPSWLHSVTVNAFINNIKGTSLFKKLKVGELIWGYEDDIIKMMKNLEGLLKFFGFKLPELSTIQLQKNGTAFAEDVGNLTILTGKENISDVQKIIRWRGMKNAPFWNTKYANMINGSEGAQAPPFLSRDQKVYAFAPQLCRSFYFNYEKDVEFHGIPMYRFVPPFKRVSANFTISPNDVQFCNDTETCLDGLISVGQCQFGNPPIYMSSPHFFRADPKLVTRIRGMKPDPKLHGSFIDIEPTIGVTMRGYKRMQVNVMARKSFLDLTKPLHHDINFLPICYVEQVGEIDDKFAAQFRNMLILPKEIVKYGRIVLMAVGSLIILMTSYLLVTRYYSKRQERRKSDEAIGKDGHQVKKELLPVISMSGM